MAAVSSKRLVELCILDTMRCCSIMCELLPLAMLSCPRLGFADGFYCDRAESNTILLTQ